MKARQVRSRMSRRYMWLGLCVLVVAAIVAARPSYVAFRLWQARQDLARHDPQRALERLSAAARIAPQDGALQVGIARAERRLGDFDEVRRRLRRAAELGQDPALLRREELLTSAQAGRISPSDPEASALLLNAGSDSLEIYDAFTRGCLETFQIANAVALLNGWQADFPRDSQPYYYRGMLHVYQNEWTDAATALRECLQRDPGRDDARRQLARVLREQYRYRAAETLYRRCLQRGEDTELLAGLGICLYGLGELDEARRTLTAALGKKPDLYEALLQLGELELAVGHAEEALRWLEPAVKQKPYEYKARLFLAWALVLSGQKDRAGEHFRAAADAQVAISRLRSLTRYVAQETESADQRYEIGAIFARSGQAELAITWLQSVLQTRPDHRAANRLLAELYAEQGNKDLAAEHQRRAGSAE